MEKLRRAPPVSWNGAGREIFSAIKRALPPARLLMIRLTRYCHSGPRSRIWPCFFDHLWVQQDLTIIVLGVIALAYFLFKTYRYLKATEIKEGESVWNRLGIKL